MTDGIDARDGLTRLQRVILWQLREAQKERGVGDEGVGDEHAHSVPTAMLYGRVVEHVDVSIEEFQRVLQQLITKK